MRSEPTKYNISGMEVYPSNLPNNWYQSRWFKLMTGSDEYTSTADEGKRSRKSFQFDLSPETGTHSGTLFSLSVEDYNDNDDIILHQLSFLRTVWVKDAAVEFISVIEEFEKLLLLSNGALFLVESELSRS
ncbi:hypothetical protein HKD37_01G001552 [Glycine soja]